MTRTVALIGAPGAGKSTIGRLLAKRLDVDFVDVDAEIERRAGKEVSAIFADDGEAHFRALEAEVTADCLARPGVVALGGGAPMTPSVREALAGHDVVWLRVSIAQAARRVGLNETRPLLVGNLRAQLIRLLEQRTPVYSALATVTVDTDKATPTQCAATIAEALA